MVQLKTNERIDHLYSADLSIIQSPDVFSYSLDALFLAHFAQIPPRNNVRIVDFCAGNGAVTLLLASQTKSDIIGIELQERLVDMAERSISLNQLDSQIKIFQQDIRDLDSIIKSDSVDIVTCNPPYFPVGAQNKTNPNPYKAIARHEVMLTIEEFVSASSRALKMGGRAYFVHRPERFLELIDQMREYRLTPKKAQFIYPKRNREAKIMLIEGIKDGKMNGFKMLPPLFIHDDKGDYLPEVEAIIYGKQS